MLQDKITAIQSLFKRYDNVPASLADACLVRMSEMHPASRVFTLDSDFHIYRHHAHPLRPRAKVSPPDPSWSLPMPNYRERHTAWVRAA